MASLSLLSQTVRSGAFITKSLTASMRVLSLTTPTPTPVQPRSRAEQTRSLSQTALSPRRKCTRYCCALPTLPILGQQSAAGQSLGGIVTQQTRGMKVHSAIRRRCEHCKVRSISEAQLTCEILIWIVDQVVRRKANKRHGGYLYIICPANPRHKQRQGYVKPR